MPRGSRNQDGRNLQTLYTPDFRMEVLDYSDTQTAKAAAEKYDVPLQTVYTWRYQRNKGSLKFPKTGEAIAALTEIAKTKTTNGAKKMRPQQRAAIVRALNRGVPITTLTERYHVDADTLAEWAQKQRPHHRRNGKRHLPARRASTTTIEEIPAHQARHQPNQPFRATPERVFERAQLLEFVLSFLMH